MIYPEHDRIVEVRRGNSDKWRTALFYRNGTRPVFAQYGSEISDVTEWRIKKGYDKSTLVPYNELFKENTP